MGAVSDFEEEASAAEAEESAADDGEPRGWVEQEQARWEAVVGRPHLETRTVVRDVFGDHAHSIWRDRYRGQEYPEDPGHAIHCTRNGCSCSFDIRPGGVFDSTLCSLHAERQDPLHGGHPFGQPAPGQDNHRSKECFLCLDDKLRRARESRAAAKAAGPAPRFPRLLLLRFYQFYQRVFLGLYRPMLAGGRCPAARWRLEVAIAWKMSGPRHLAQVLRQCRDLRNCMRRYMLERADAADRGGLIDVALPAALAEQQWFQSVAAGESPEECECDMCDCTLFSTAQCAAHQTRVAGGSLFVNGRGMEKGALFKKCCHCRDDEKSKRLETKKRQAEAAAEAAESEEDR